MPLHVSAIWNNFITSRNANDNMQYACDISISSAVFNFLKENEKKKPICPKL